MSDMNQSDFDPYQPQNPETAPKKKNRQPLLVAFSILGVLIILALAALIYYLLFFTPTSSLIIGGQGQQVNYQETALQAAAEATAVEIYLHPTQAQGEKAAPSQLQTPSATGLTQPVEEASETPAPSTDAGGKTQKGPSAESQLQPAGTWLREQWVSFLSGKYLTTQVALLGFLIVVTILLLAIIVVRRLRSSR